MAAANRNALADLTGIDAFRPDVGAIPPGEVLGGPGNVVAKGPDVGKIYTDRVPQDGTIPSRVPTAADPLVTDSSMLPAAPVATARLPAARYGDFGAPAAPVTAAAPTAPAYEGSEPNMANNVNQRMANYSPRPPSAPDDGNGASAHIIGDQSLDAAVDSSFVTGGPPETTTGTDVGNGRPSFNDGNGVTMGDGGDSPIIIPGETTPETGGNGATPPDGEGGETPTPPVEPIAGIEAIMPWDVSTFMQIYDAYKAAGIDYTPEDFVNEYYDTRALANPSVELPDAPPAGAAATLAAARTASPEITVNPDEEALAA
jgi:hypothetical protein